MSVLQGDLEQQDFAVANGLVAPEYVDHDSSHSAASPEGVRQEVSLYRNAFPDRSPRSTT